MLQNPVPPLPCSKGEAGVVGQPVFSVEWGDSGTERAGPSNRIPHWLGGSVSGTLANESSTGKQGSSAAAKQPDRSNLQRIWVGQSLPRPQQ